MIVGLHTLFSLGEKKKREFKAWHIWSHRSWAENAHRGRSGQKGRSHVGQKRYSYS